MENGFPRADGGAQEGGGSNPTGPEVRTSVLLARLRARSSSDIEAAPATKHTKTGDQGQPGATTEEEQEGPHAARCANFKAAVTASPTPAAPVDLPSGQRGAWLGQAESSK